MPKMKTNRAAAKRFKRTGKGKVKRYRAYKGHLREAKSSKQIRALRKSKMLNKSDTELVHKMLPYIGKNYNKK